MAVRRFVSLLVAVVVAAASSGFYCDAAISSSSSPSEGLLRSSLPLRSRKGQGYASAVSLALATWRRSSSTAALSLEGDDHLSPEDEEGGGSFVSEYLSFESHATASSPRIRAGFIAKLFSLQEGEVRKFLTMSAMMFCIVYVFTMTRDTKDTLVVTNCGAESIAFLKVYGVVPAATCFMLGYNWLSNRVGHRALFRMTMIPFLVFYGLFGFVLYPLRTYLHPYPAMAASENGLAYVVNIFRFWAFSLYYIVSELWGSAGIPLLFWTCANDVTPLSQAKRLYSLFGLLGNLAPIASGQTMVMVRSWLKDKKGLSGDAAFESSMKITTAAMMAAGTLIMILYETVQNMRLKEIDEEEKSGKKSRSGEMAKKKSKPKMTMMESFRFLAGSSYLRCIALLVVSYGLMMEFTEIIWKAIVKLSFPDKTDYLAFMGQYSKIVGSASFFMLLLGNRLIKYFGWEFGALMTPVVMTSLSIPFFALISFGDIQSSKRALTRALYLGMVQNVLSKACKYSVFDPTKEMAYIPLDPDSKVKGKAAIDVLGARLGKSGGALAQQGLVVLLGSILRGAPVLAAMLSVVAFLWISAVIRLGEQFRTRMEEHSA